MKEHSNPIEKGSRVEQRRTISHEKEWIPICASLRGSWRPRVESVSVPVKDTALAAKGAGFGLLQKMNAVLSASAATE